MAKPPPAKGSKSPVSMTGFSRGSKAAEGTIIEVDLRSVNARYLELTCKLPRIYQPFEGELRAKVSERIRRGRVDLLVTRIVSPQKTFESVGRSETVAPLVKSYLGLCSEFGASKEGLSHFIADVMLRRDLVASAEESNVPESEKNALLSAVSDAVTGLVQMRSEEGRALGSEIRKHLEQLSELHSRIESQVSNAPAEVKARLLSRLAKLAPEVTLDPTRLAQEAALLADRSDVTEEVVRLKSHFEQLSSALAGEGEGKRLDFLLQECFREFNTIGSKAQSASVQALIVDAKVILEKVREQVQNLE